MSRRLGDESWPPDDEHWPSAVAPLRPFASPGDPGALAAPGRAFLADELNAAIELYPALAPVPGRDPRLADASFAEPWPAIREPSDPEDAVPGIRPALAPVPDRDPRLGNVP